MTQASRPGQGAGRIASDDPIERLSAWFQANSRPLLLGAGGVAAIAVAVFGYRAYQASTNSQASAALRTAQLPLYEGKSAEARAELEKVVQRFGGTPAGQQAVLLLARTMYEQGQYVEGVKLLEGARGGAPRPFAAPIEGLIAAGYEGTGDHAKAAEHHGKAAEAAESDGERGQHKAAQARSLMAASRFDEAAAIWRELAQDEKLAHSDEARVRLGELAGRGRG